jgi:hypothetical protein
LRLTIKRAAHTTISAPTIGIIPSATSKALLSLRSTKARAMKPPTIEPAIHALICWGYVQEP